MKIAMVAIFFALCPAVTAQHSLKTGPTVNGLGLGATREEVIRKLGRPLSERKKKADECVGGIEMTLRYPGLIFQLWDDSEKPGEFTVGMFEVTSAKWNVSRAKVGQTKAEIKSMFGDRSSEENETASKQLVWYYDMDENEGPGNTNFYFRNGRVVRILSMWMMC